MSSTVRWYHQSWAVIGSLVVLASFFVFSLQSTVFLALLQILVVGFGLWLWFSAMDRTLTSRYPAILELRDWWRDRGGSRRRLSDHRDHDGTFLLLGHDADATEPGAGLDGELARSLQPWGPLLACSAAGPDALEHARRAWLVFVELARGPETDSIVARLREDPNLWSRTVLLVPPAPGDTETSLDALRRLDVNVPRPVQLVDGASGGFVVAARPDRVPTDCFPLIDVESGSVLAASLVRARPDLVHGPQAAPGAQVVVDTSRASRTDDGAVVASLWLQPAEARLGVTRELWIDGRLVEVRMPEGLSTDHQLRVPCQVGDPGGELRDLVLDIQVS